ncbi:hypothetical protein RGQ29_024624 [Quercus rubra]|uniref:Uncharacterized protein n=1 Tax=Quercus rubra TaxID=3512 RepID=A0AAN7EVW5_QUERU|nr:hypothetical protein RGQ29_024624 [Quercus rubra]
MRIGWKRSAGAFSKGREAKQSLSCTGSDPVRVELNRLENDLRDKDRELGDALAEIKSLKNSERLKEKAVEENIEIKKINDEKKAAWLLNLQLKLHFEGSMLQQKDDEMPPIEAIITPLEAELKLARLEVAKLQDDNRALDRLTKSKEAALLEAERTVQIALAKASLEENKIMDKMHRQKVAEVEKLTPVRELEEAVLAGGAAANAVRDYQRKVQEMNEERKTLEREVARAKWKDANDKVMPVKQWLEERNFSGIVLVYHLITVSELGFFHDAWKKRHTTIYPCLLFGEMQQLRDKLAEKYQLRFKVLEERLKTSNGNSRIASEGRTISNGSSRRQSLGGAENFSKTSNSQYGLLRSNSASTLLKHGNISNRSFDGGSRSLDRGKLIPDASGKDNVPINTCDHNLISETNGTHMEKQEDYVSGMLYDMLQKEVTLKDKDDAIEMLAKKVDTLNKAMEVEAKKMRREVAAKEKEVAAIRVSKDHDQRMRRISTPRGAVNSSHLTSARSNEDEYFTHTARHFKIYK